MPSQNRVFVGKTDFPLRPDPAAKGALPHFPSSPTASFRLLDGPPYANGAPHLGHVLNKHLKDALARAANATGKAVEWRPGWDCHGLPLELAVEKQGVLRADRPAFVAAARDFASTQAKLQSGVFEQQGWSAQWRNPWHTQDPDMEAGTLRVLARLLERGLLEVRFAAVPWCPQCQSTVSNAEQEDREVSTLTWVVPFAMDNGEVLLSWTTTPWTLPMHQGLLVNPDACYVQLVKDDQVAWVSQATAETWAKRLGAQVSSVVCWGSALVGRGYATPWTRSRVSAAPEVCADAGTGVLHAVAGLAELDTMLALRHGWDVRAYLRTDGVVQDSACVEQNGRLAGPAASEPVRSAYDGSRWFKQMNQSAQQPHCWRHKVPLLTRPSRQVFLSLSDQVRRRAEEMVAGMEFSPPSARQRLQAAMRDRPSWCLSRQRTWGVPLALFLDRRTGQPHEQAAVFMRRVADAMHTQGVEAWWSSPSARWLGEVDEASVERVDDVLDVWFDSGCVPQLLGAADAVVEGVDQHRGWFQSCVWLAAALDAPSPFARVVCHGFVVDGSGGKLSKSTGGDGAPSVNHWSALPTDVVRVWAMAGTDGNDKAWTPETVQQAQGWLARWRGVARFMLANALPSPCQSADLAPAWDRYWWHRCRDARERVVGLVAQARFGEAVSTLALFGEEFSSLALDSWKDRLYCAPPETAERQQLDAVVKGCLEEWGAMLEVMAPRLRAQAQAFWPHHPAPSCPALSGDDRKEVEDVLRVRAALAPHAEVLNKTSKGGGVLRRVSTWPCAPHWPSQLLADALGVGQVVPAWEEGPKVVLAQHPQQVVLAFGLSPDPACPRCRRVQHPWQGEVCGACVKRLAH